MCVTLRENEIKGQVRENKKVLSIGIFFAKHLVLGFDFISWCYWVLGVISYCVWKIRKCKNSKKIKESEDFFFSKKLLFFLLINLFRNFVSHMDFVIIKMLM